jgi:hypothetical protein
MDLPPEDAALLDRIAARIVALGMATPAIFFLESVRPLNFVASQAMVFFGPLATAILPRAEYERLARILEDRASIEALLVRIEERLERDEP